MAHMNNLKIALKQTREKKKQKTEILINNENSR